MHIHILGICGTFMAGVAVIARQLGHTVTGCDQATYPPMSTMLEQQGIALTEGYDPKDWPQGIDLFLIGNAMSRGNPSVEAILSRNLSYRSAPQWLHDEVLSKRWVLAVAGTHGKTTTTSILAWMLEAAGYQPGFLVGGIPRNFGVSARLGASDFFVIEADEYDTAFFDKRSKFVHYCPKTLIVNNIEFDHADIFSDLAAIQRQFSHLLRLVPQEGLVLHDNSANVQQVLEQGIWSEQQSVEPNQGQWRAELIEKDGSVFDVYFDDVLQGQVSWSMLGQHNVHNALAAIAAARHVGIQPAQAISSLAEFVPPKRRLELLGQRGERSIYDDFAHHPTAIETTLQGLRRNVGQQPIWAVIEPRSNTMKRGVHNERLPLCWPYADHILLVVDPSLGWDASLIAEQSAVPVQVVSTVEQAFDFLSRKLPENAHVVCMSNGGFGGLPQRLMNEL